MVCNGYDMSVLSEKLCADIMTHAPLQQEYLCKCKWKVFPLETPASCL